MQPARCRVHVCEDRFELRFDVPQKPIAPGQVAAFYIGDELIGGGIVSAVC